MTILVVCGVVVVVVTTIASLLLLRFIRKLQQAREALAQSQERLSLTLHASGVAVWSWDIATSTITPDENCSAVFGLPPGQFVKTGEEFAALLHPDDRERVLKETAASIQSGADYYTDFRVVGQDGALRYLSVRGKVYRGKSGEPYRFTGVTWDVTERWRAEENLRLANEKLTQSLRELERRKEQASILHKMTDLLQACSSSVEAYDIVAQFCSHLFPRYSGALYIFSASRNLVKSVATWKDPRVSDVAFEPDDCWALRRGQPYIVDPGQFATPCRHLKDIQGGHACLPLMAQGTGLGILYLQEQQNRQDDGAEVPGECLTLEDRQLAITVAENIAISLSNLYLQETLRIQSIRDPLTGLFNRRYLEESGERELYRMARGKQPAGLAMIDLDHFKTLNDTFGHEGGDALLRTFGQFLREHLRKEDIACRYGGEEFCILFCESSLDDTVRRAEQLRAEVIHLTVQHRGQHLGAVTMSIGVASYPTHGSILTDLIAAADKALYQAKTDGRNRVVIATTTPTP
jgi:diguanylate cyclase (GGDEF)-like protein/PAS domain S-box-containing protein